MVHGLEKFKEYFEDHTNQYVFIGGTACDILLSEYGVPFRATKDLDMVIIIEALDITFAETFWHFIEDGGYEHCEKNTGENQFYRFSKPKDASFPKMIELFSKLPNNLEKSFNQKLIPIHIDESTISLSAILLNDDYYELLLQGKRIIDGISLIEIETVLLFKIKAWLDMKVQKDTGKEVDMKNIKKHKNDVFRLMTHVLPTSRIAIPKRIQKDVIQFIEQIKKDKPDLRNLGIKGSNFDEMLKILGNIFLVNEEN
jgi:hypothetical protein